MTRALVHVMRRLLTTMVPIMSVRRSLPLSQVWGHHEVWEVWVVGQGPEAHPDAAALLLEMGHFVVDALEREVWNFHYRHAQVIHVVISCMPIAVLIIFIASVVLTNEEISIPLAW